MTKNDFFFCYDKRIMKYLRYEKKIGFITVAIHEKTGNKFWLFLRNEQLVNALEDMDFVS